MIFIPPIILFGCTLWKKGFEAVDLVSMDVCVCVCVCVLRKGFLKNFIYLERGEGREKERRETSVCGCLLCAPLTGDLACNPSMCPDWELNQWPSDSQALSPLSHTSQGSAIIKKKKKSLWLMWLSGFSAGLLPERLPVRF